MTPASPAPRRVLKLAVAILGTALALGMTYQGVATALERRDFPPPGARVGIGDHQLHLTCQGDGAPVVVLEAAEAGFSPSWTRVQRALAPRTRVCAYDRAGLGWSEAAGLTFDASRVADELHALLGAAPVRRPVILVGQSLGAWFATIHAGRFGDDLAGLVLVDEPRPEDEEGLAALDARMRWAPWLARTGLLRVGGQFAALADGLPEPAAGATRTFLLRPDHLTRVHGELAQRDAARAMAAQATLPEGLAVLRVRTPGHTPGTFPVSDDAVRVIDAAVRRLLPAGR